MSDKIADEWVLRARFDAEVREWLPHMGSPFCPWATLNAVYAELVDEYNGWVDLNPMPSHKKEPERHRRWMMATEHWRVSWRAIRDERYRLLQRKI